MVAEKGRGEVGELRSQLMRLSGGGSSPEKIAQKRDLFRKLIMLGTIGQDMSSLFMQVSVGAQASEYASPAVPHELNLVLYAHSVLPTALTRRSSPAQPRTRKMLF